MRIAAAIAILALLAQRQPADAAPFQCKGNPWVVGDCFTLHGRYRAYNGTPAFRIWRVGTHRILGVHGDIRRALENENPEIPENLARAFSATENQVFADFTLCPYTQPKRGEMQQVCIESVANVVVYDIKSERSYRLLDARYNAGQKHVPVSQH